MDLVEAWEKVETLYRNHGVTHCPMTGPQVCLITAINKVLSSGENLYGSFNLLVERNLLDEMRKELERVTDSRTLGGVALYNDSHTKEENLAVIAQCRSEAQAKQHSANKQEPSLV
jgi:hypothetical protein